MYISLDKNRDGSRGVQVGGTQQPGWAYLPETIQRPECFPYVEIEVEQVRYRATATTPAFTRLEVTAMSAGERIENPAPESDTGSAVYDEMAAAYRQGVQEA